MRDVECSFCRLNIAEGKRYYRYQTGQLLCEACDDTHGMEFGLECIRGSADWWESPTEIYDDWPHYEPNMPALLPDYSSKGKEAVMESATSITLNKGDVKVNFNRVELVFTQETFNQMFTYVDASSIEISGLGRIKKEVKDHTISFIVEELFLLKQKNTAASTHLDPAALAEFVIDRVEKNQSVHDVKLWFHSHVNMQAFWSGTDDACCDAFENEGQEADNWYLSIVVNKKREMKARLDIYKPYRLVLYDIPVKVYMGFNLPDRKKYEQEVKDKCSEKRWRDNFMGDYHRRRPSTSFDITTDQEIERAYANGTQENLDYVKDMDEAGKKIEAINYKHGEVLYKYLSLNNKAGDPKIHKIPAFKNISKHRAWYLDKDGVMCSKNTTRIIKPRADVTKEEEIIFYKFLPGCACDWCKEQGEIIERCEKVANKKTGEDAS